MSSIIKKVFTKRSLLGTLLLTILIGEPTVGLKTGLFSPIGIIIFFFLYLTLFHLFESLIFKFNLVVYQVIFLTFAIYSVFVTGLLNKELTEYVLQPNPIITLIRIQASFFVAFAFYLLNKWAPRNETKIMSLKQASIFFAVFVSLFSLTGIWGIPSLIFAFQTTPLLSILFSIAAVVAVYIALKSKSQPTLYQSKKLTWLIYFYLLMGAIPNLVTFMILLITMIAGGVYLLLNKSTRNHPL